MLVCCYSFSVVPLNPTPVFPFFFSFSGTEIAAEDVNSRYDSDLKPIQDPSSSGSFVSSFFFFYISVVIVKTSHALNNNLKTEKNIISNYPKQNVAESL